MLKIFLIEWIVYSAAGTLGELVFTALGRVFGNLRVKKRVERNLHGFSSLWAVFYFGLSSAVSFGIILPKFFPAYFSLWWVWRGLVCVFGIYCWEYVWGKILDSFGARPWQYHFKLWRISSENINLWYAGFWYAAGLGLELLHTQFIPWLLRP